MDITKLLGSSCRVISKQGIRYSGTLYSIDAHGGRIQVTNVQSFGTEDRPAAVFIPPLDQAFPLIEFHVNDLSDFKVDEGPPAAPATVAPTVGTSTQVQTPPVIKSGTPASSSTPAPVAPTPPAANPASFSAEKAMPPGWERYSKTQQPQQSSVDTEQVQRAMNNLNITNGSSTSRPAPGLPSRGSGQNSGQPQRGRGRGGPRANGPHQSHQQSTVKIPTTEFDFQESNKRFDKTAAVKQHQLLMNVKSDVEEIHTSAEKPEESSGKAADKPKTFYNPTKSFFDNLSSEGKSPQSQPRPPRVDQAAAGEDRNGQRGTGRGRGRGYGRMRRDEEREKNVETFGEPGGVGLLGPGAYVGGYGGYRGKRRRGGGPSRGRGVSNGGAPRASVTQV